VSASSIAVVDEALGTFVDNEAMSDMRFASVYKGNQKQVAYVNFYKHIGLLYCHIVTCKDKAMAATVVQALNEAVVLAAKPKVEEEWGFDGNILKLVSDGAYDVEMDVKSKQKEIDSLGQIVGVIESLRCVNLPFCCRLGKSLSRQVVLPACTV
jgi:hypothetical protein